MQYRFNYNTGTCISMHTVQMFKKNLHLPVIQTVYIYNAFNYQS